MTDKIFKRMKLVGVIVTLFIVFVFYGSQDISKEVDYSGIDYNVPSENCLITDFDFRRQFSEVEIGIFMEEFYNSALDSDMVDIVLNYSKQYNISPLVILTKLEQEQSLVSGNAYHLRDPETRERAINRACGFGSYEEFLTGTKKYYGFENQVFRCARALNKWATNWREGDIIKYKQGLGEVVPYNGPTAALYTYCPAYGEYSQGVGNPSGFGNIIFERIFYRYKTKMEEKLSYWSNYTVLDNPCKENINYLITVDDGPNINSLYLAEIFKNHGIQAIFFVTSQGRNFSNNQVNIMRKLNDMGMIIANHSYTHSRHVFFSGNESMIYDDIKVIEDNLDKYNIDHVSIFRPPYGINTTSVRNAVKSNGLSMMMWTIDTYDWKRYGMDRYFWDEFHNSAYLPDIYPDNIVLMHSLSYTVENINFVLNYIKSKGGHCVEDVNYFIEKFNYVI